MTRSQVLTLSSVIAHRHKHMRIVSTQQKGNEYEMELIDTTTNKVHTIKYLRDWLNLEGK